MARKAGTITIDLNAGTAKFLVDMDKANAKIKEFGKSGVSEAKAVGAGMKALEGDVLKNGRAAEAFLESFLKAGPVLKAAFPVIGAVAFGSTIIDTTNRVKELIQEVKDAPAKTAAAFREMMAPVRQANDDMAVANARLQQDIAKLEGKRENTLQTMLLEAKSAADKLADSLERDLTALDRVLKDNEQGFWAKLLGKAGTGDIRELIGGETGYGGLRASVATLTGQFSARFAGAGSAEEKDAIQRELDERLRRLYQATLDQVNAKLAQGPQVSGAGLVGSIASGGAMSAFADDRVRVESLQSVARMLQEEMSRVSATSTNARLTARKNELQAGANAADATRPFDDRIRTLESQMEGARSRLESAGLGPTAKALTDAYAESLKVIADVNNALEKHHRSLGEDQKAQIQSLVGTTALTTAEAGFQERLAQTTAQIREQVRSQEMLTDAVGQGAAAERRARVETRLMMAVGAENFGNPAWMLSHADEVANLRGVIASDVDAQRRQQSATAVYGLTQELRLQQLLTDAQREGEEAIRQITAAEILRSGIERGLTGHQIAQEIALYYAKLRTQSTANVAKLEAETTQTERLTAAQIQGAEAARKQALENKYAEMERLGQGGEVGAARAADEASHQAEITGRVAARVNLYRDEAERLDQELAKLREIVGGHKATIDQARTLRDLQRDRLRLWVQEQLAIGTAKAGVRAFFAEMEAGSKRASNVVYDNLMSGVDRVSDELARLFTGQKTNFGQMLKEMGTQLTRDTIKLGLEKGLGAIGKALGIQMPEAKPDGTKAKPFHVIVENDSGSGASGSAAAGALGGVLGGAGGGVLGGLLKKGIGAVGGLLRGIFGGGALSGSVGIAGFLADGGPVSPSQAYIVGEAGPELLTRASGRITSNADLRRSLGSGGDTFNTSVDARGAELGVEQRVYRAIAAAHRASVSSSVRAQHERMLRTPQRVGV